MSDPVVALLASVVVGWAATLLFGGRVARLPLGRLTAGMLFVSLTAVLGARLHYVMASSTAPTIAARLTESGVHAAGGVLGLMAGLLLLPRVVGLSAAVLADVAAVGTGPALATYRLGCHLRGCCIGTVTGLPWGIRYDGKSVAYLLHENAGLIDAHDSWSAPVHPLPLYFAAAAVLISAVGCVAYRRRRYDGQVALMGFALFSLSTLVLESLRAPIPGQTYWGPLRQLVWVAGGMAIASLFLIARLELQGRHGRLAADR